MKPKKTFSENGAPPSSSNQPKWYHKIGYWGKKIWNDPVWSSVIAIVICGILYALSKNKISLIIAGLVAVVLAIIIIKKLTLTRGCSRQKKTQNKELFSKIPGIIFKTLTVLALTATFTGHTLEKILQTCAKNYTIYCYDETIIVKRISYTKNTDTFPLDSIHKEGYKFEGWYDNADKTGDPIFEIPKGSKGDKKFGGKWILLEYHVTFFTDGGSPIPPDTSYTKNSEDLLLPKKLTKSGYYFKGWTLGLGTLTVDKIPKGSMGDKKLWALWEKTSSLYTDRGVGVQEQNRNPCVVTVLKSGYGSKERAIRFATQEAEEKFRIMYPNIPYAIDQPITRQEGINWEAEVTVREINR